MNQYKIRDNAIYHKNERAKPSIVGLNFTKNQNIENSSQVFEVLGTIADLTSDLNWFSF